MSIKIIATSIGSFSKIEEALGKLDKDFISKFDTAEYAVAGFTDIKLVSTQYVDNEIELPTGFVINEFFCKQFSEYDKDATTGEIKEIVKNRLELRGDYENQLYKLVYLNIRSMNIRIGF